MTLEKVFKRCSLSSDHTKTGIWQGATIYEFRGVFWPQGSMYMIYTLGGSVLPSNECSSSPVNPDFQGSPSSSGPPCPQGLLTSQGPPRSQASVSDLRKQLRKRTVFSQEQKLVLQEHFDECMHPSQEQCMALAQRLGLKESHIKVCPLSCLPSSSQTASPPEHTCTLFLTPGLLVPSMIGGP